MVILINAVEAEPGASVGYAYGRTQHGREVVIVAGIGRMARLARKVRDAASPLRVWCSPEQVLFSDGGRP